ncbi:tetratricopeptide repeat protein [uncultured Paludibaculum sp.]|uniref:tetratricopeptide repeat protein n=1 Tax=uncultured Paludibaculum sp. TaxID=1765020 RepID=UPI002AABCE35|nr:tetratricopeptide repeat protein [uncultured Paludibaculum sp.]
MKHRNLVRTIVTIVLAAWQPIVAAPSWRVLESGHWELVTDMNAKDGTRILRQLLEMNSVLGALTKPMPDSAPPVRVLLFRSESDFRPFQQAAWNKGLFHPGAERDYVMLLNSGDETARAGRHEVAHMSMHHSSTILPPWLEEGLAEYFSTLQRKGNKVTLGQPIQQHIDRLATAEWLPTAQLTAWRDDGPMSSQPADTLLVYAQSWALTSLLMQPADGQARIGRFGELLRTGVEQTAAFEQAFGRSMENALNEARQAVMAKRYPTREVTIGAAPEPGPFQSRNLSDVEARLLRADALLARGKQAEADQLVTETARRYPDLASAVAGLGYLAMAKTDYAAARQYLEKALAMGDRQATTYYQLAMLIRDTNGDVDKVVPLLRQAVEVNPSFGDAWYMLGSMRLRQGATAEAVEAMRHAAEGQPRKSMFWEGLGRARQAAGQGEEARAAAQQAIATATTPEQSAMAQGLVRELAATQKAAPAKRPSIVVPKTWEARQGDASVTGKLVMVDCATSTLKFHIQTAPATAKSRAQVTILASDKPNQIILRGNSTEKREFVCGAQRNAPLVEAFYVTAAPVEEPKPAAPPTKQAPGKRPTPAAKPKPAAKPPAGELVILDFK